MFHGNSGQPQNRDFSFASKSGPAVAGAGGDPAPVLPWKQEWEWLGQPGSPAWAWRGTFSWVGEQHSSKPGFAAPPHSPSPLGGARVLVPLVPSVHRRCAQWLRPLPLHVSLLTFLYLPMWHDDRRFPAPGGSPGRGWLLEEGLPRAPSRLWWASSAGSGLRR